MGWPDIIERLYLSDKLTSVQVDNAQTKGLITVPQAIEIKAKKENLSPESVEV